MRWSLAGVSRGVRSHALQSDALSDPRGYVAELRTLTRDEGIDTLLPTTDPSVEAVLEYRAMLPEQLHVPLPSLAAYRAASDKARMLELARNCGLAGPETRGTARRGRAACGRRGARRPGRVPSSSPP